VVDGAARAGARCSPAAYDAGPDAFLPAWGTGFFFAEAPTGGSDAFDLRVGPAGEFALAVTGCDVIGTSRGMARADDGGIWLLPAPGESAVYWPTDVALGDPVPNVLLTPGLDGGLVAVTEAGVSTWSAGLNCGCGEFRACGCEDPFE